MWIEFCEEEGVVELAVVFKFQGFQEELKGKKLRSQHDCTFLRNSIRE